MPTSQVCGNERHNSDACLGAAAQRSEVVSATQEPFRARPGSDATPNPQGLICNTCWGSFPSSTAAASFVQDGGCCTGAAERHRACEWGGGRDATVLALEEGHHQKKQAPGTAAAQQNGFAHTNGVANGIQSGQQNELPNGTANGVASGDHPVVVLGETRPHNYPEHTTMWGTHHFGERTHAGVQQRHYKAVKWLGARAHPRLRNCPLSSASLTSSEVVG